MPHEGIDKDARRDLAADRVERARVEKLVDWEISHELSPDDVT